MDQEVFRFFEKLENLIERRFDKVEETQTDVQKRVGNLEVIAAEQKEQIKYHIKRTDLSEERTELYRQEALKGIAEVAVEARLVAEKLEDHRDDTALKLEQQRQKTADDLMSLKVNEKARKISSKQIAAVLGILFALASTVAAFLALK